MSEPYELLDIFTEQSKAILGDELVGIYLHGSAAMGCFNPGKSDLDIITVTSRSITDAVKKSYMDMAVSLNNEAPEKGIEFSIVRAAVCSPFVYPTPFELHFSAANLDWYTTAPDDYIKKMKGTDKDLAAHFMIIRRRGKVLFGRPINDVFGEVSKEYYYDSIWSDIENAREDIINDPMYIILNLSRVLAYSREGLVLSKKEGGEWALAELPEKYHGLVSSALNEYENGNTAVYDGALSADYAEYMLSEIQTAVKK